MFRRRKDRVAEQENGTIIDGQGRWEIAKRLSGKRQDKRNERKEKRRKFFLAFSSNVKWIMLAAAVIAVLLFAKFGLPIVGGV